MDYTGIHSFLYSIVSENTSTINTEVKIVVIGEKGTGTKKIIDKFFEDTTSKTDSTTGDRFKLIQLEAFQVKIIIETPSDHEYLSTIAPIFYKNAHGIAYVYDSSDKKSFTAIQKMINKVSDQFLDKKSILIANS